MVTSETCPVKGIPSVLRAAVVYAPVCLALASLPISGCGGDRDNPRQAESAADSLIALAQRFVMYQRSGDYDRAREMMADDPRRWYGAREDTGYVWAVGPGAGRWSAWDDHFRSRKKDIGWRAENRSAILTMKETNDYFLLLDRGWVTNEIVYYFDTGGRIKGTLVRAIGERPPGRTEAFLAWARENDPEELDYLMPGGEIDPTGDRPPRFRALLNRWRESAGLDAIE